jgi:hypothetical protein
MESYPYWQSISWCKVTLTCRVWADAKLPVLAECELIGKLHLLAECALNKSNNYWQIVSWLKVTLTGRVCVDLKLHLLADCELMQGYAYWQSVSWWKVTPIDRVCVDWRLHLLAECELIENYTYWQSVSVDGPALPKPLKFPPLSFFPPKNSPRSFPRRTLGPGYLGAGCNYNAHR